MYWKSALSIPYSPLMDCYFYTSANGEWQVAVYTLLFFFIVSINGLLLLHIYKGEWAVNRICLMAFLHCLH